MPNLIYVNSLNESVIFTYPNFYVGSYELRNFLWNYNSEYEKISSFNHDGIGTRTLPIYILGNNESEAYELRNSLFKVFETDVISKIPGKFYFGEYYYKGFVVGSKKEEYMVSKRLLKLELTVASDLNIWIKESTFTFDTSSKISGHGYPYKYPYGYAYGASLALTNESLSASDFKITVYGEALNPTIYVGQHRYTINMTVEQGEYLEIDSLEKRVELVHFDGSKSKVFAYRDRGTYIFQKIPPGTQLVSWNRNFGFDLTIYARRSEPLWI